MIKTKKYGDIISAIAVLAIIGVYYVASFFYRAGGGNVGGNTLFPRVVSLVLCVSSLHILITACIRLHREKKSEVEISVSAKEKSSANSNLKVVLILLLMGVYAFVLPWLGFLVSTLVFLTVLLYLLSQKPKRKLIKLLIISIVTVVFIYVIFSYVLTTVFPAGKLWHSLGWG
jgi:ABC-type Fe3+-siderophore transport system permease subunit